MPVLHQPTTVVSSAYNIAAQEKLLGLVKDYLMGLANDNPEFGPIGIACTRVRTFPTIDELVKNGILQWGFVARLVAEYESELIQVANTLHELGTKKIQIRVFLHNSERECGDGAVRQFSKDVNFYISRLIDIENILRSKLETLDKCIWALRTLKYDAPKSDRPPSSSSSFLE
jgi:hypothetical protein